MRLHELTGIKKFNPNDEKNDRYYFHEWMEDHGWIYRSDGGFSSVYSRPDKDYVIKVIRDKDPGYQHFLKLVEQHPNKHFPKIYNKLKTPWDNEITAIKMEKLESLIFPEKRLISHLSDFYDIKNPTDEEIKEMKNIISKLGQDESFYDAMALLKQQKGNLGNDFGSSNVKKRSDGTLVIIDPYVG